MKEFFFSQLNAVLTTCKEFKAPFLSFLNVCFEFSFLILRIGVFVSILQTFVLFQATDFVPRVAEAPSLSSSSPPNKVIASLWPEHGPCLVSSKRKLRKAYVTRSCMLVA